MTTENIIARLCNLPLDFHRDGKSSLQLVKESGVEQETLSVPAIEAYLCNYPHLIEQWLIWSYDKRCSEGWFITEAEDGFTVGYLDAKSAQMTNLKKFNKAIPACAEFIAKEVQSHLKQLKK